MVKFYGMQEEFIERLDKHFKSADKGKVVGNHFRYSCVYNDIKLNINLYSNGTVQCQPSDDTILKLVKDVLENTNDNIANGGSINIQVIKNENDDYVMFNGVKYIKEQ